MHCTHASLVLLLLLLAAASCFLCASYADGRFDLAAADGPHALDLGDVLYAPNLMVDEQVGGRGGRAGRHSRQGPEEVQARVELQASLRW